MSAAGGIWISGRTGKTRLNTRRALRAINEVRRRALKRLKKAQQRRRR